MKSDHIKYRSEIDGLRAVAVVPVVLFHAGFDIFSGGYVGVDVFFVISGFLITKIISEEMAAGRFSFVNFYERRARRILPALFATVAFSGALGIWLMPPNDLVEFSKATIASLLFSSNFWFWQSANNYFADSVETAPLLHTWSLAIEEQFYIGFPFLLLVLYRHWPHRIPVAVAIVTAVSFLISIPSLIHYPGATFYLLPTRAWELGVGSMLALVAPRANIGSTSRELVSLAGLIAIVAAVFLYTAETPFPGPAAIAPVFGSAAIIWAGQTFVGRLLSNKIVVWFGLISYSLYLWHWPILVYLRRALGEDLSLSIRILAVATSVTMAYLSWRWIEKPFRTKHGFKRNTIFAASLFGSGLLATGATFVVATNGMHERLDPKTAAIARAASDSVECPGRKLDDGYCLIGKTGQQPVFALIGDSHAEAVAPAFSKLAMNHDVAGIVIIRRGCPPLSGVVKVEDSGCSTFMDDAINYIRRRPQIQTIFLTGRWPLWRSGTRPIGEISKGTATLRRVGFSSLKEPQPVVFDSAFRKTVAELRTAQKKIVVISDVPEMGYDVPTIMFREARVGTPAPPKPTGAYVASRQLRVNAFLRKEIGRDGIFVDLSQALCQNGCKRAFGGVPLYRDDNHLTASAASEMLPIYLDKAFVQSVNSERISP